MVVLEIWDLTKFYFEGIIKQNFVLYYRTMKSIRKAIKILEILSQNEEGVRVTQLSRSMNLPKSSIHQILSTLKEARFVEQDSESKRYRLGLRIFELGNIFQSQLEIRKIAHPYLYNLSKKINETAYLVLLEDDTIVYVDCVESTARLRAHPIFGIKVPLHCTSLGKAIMAFLPEEKIDEIISKGLERFTKNTITDPGKLKEELKKIKNKGYAIDNMEHEEGIKCVGAPIRNHRGEVFAAISLSGPSQRFTPERIREMAPLVMQAANEISFKLGYRDPGEIKERR